MIKNRGSAARSRARKHVIFQISFALRLLQTLLCWVISILYAFGFSLFPAEKKPPKVKDHHAYIRDFYFVATDVGNYCIQSVHYDIWLVLHFLLSTKFCFLGQMINKTF
jgi:hypothetical protein